MTREEAEKFNLLYLKIGAELQQSSDYIKDHSEAEDVFDELHPTAKVMASLYFELMEPLYNKFPDLLPEHLDGPYKAPAEVLNPIFYEAKI